MQKRLCYTKSHLLQTRTGRSLLEWCSSRYGFLYFSRQYRQFSPFFYQYAEAGYNHKGDAPLLLNSYERLEKKQKKQCYTQQMV